MLRRWSVPLVALAVAAALSGGTFASPVAAARRRSAPRGTALARQHAAEFYMDAVYQRVVAERLAAEAKAAAEAQAAAGAEAARQEAARQAAELEAAARSLQSAVNRSLAAVPVSAAPLSTGGGFDAFRACTIAIESHGNYATNTGNGYYGAWQFAAGTWVNAVSAAGYPQYAGTTADQAPPSVQDAAAAWLYGQSGNQPWGGRC